MSLSKFTQLKINFICSNVTFNFVSVKNGYPAVNAADLSIHLSVTPCFPFIDLMEEIRQVGASL